MRTYTKHRANGTAKIKRDNYSNKSTNTDWWTIRKEVFERDGGRCQSRVGGRICGRPGNDVHHIIPLNRGGTTTKSNLMTVCDDCHGDRHSHIGQPGSEKPKPKNPYGRKPKKPVYRP